MLCPFLLLFSVGIGFVCGREQSSVPQCRGVFDFYFVLDRYDDIAWQNYGYIIVITTAMVNKHFIYLWFCYLQSHTIQCRFQIIINKITLSLNTVIIFVTCTLCIGPFMTRIAQLVKHSLKKINWYKFMHWRY